MSFKNSELPQRPSQMVLNQLYEYDDFMQSVASLVDLGCGTGEDLEWWATRTTRDEVPEPLNIRCVGVDVLDRLPVARKYSNITYQRKNFEESISAPDAGFDVIWCNNAFQYAVNPVKTLSNWWSMTSDGGMLTLIVPQTILINQRRLAYYQDSHCLYHYTLVNLIHLLSMSGWDCKSGFFLQKPNDPWIYAIVYKSQHKPMDPQTTSWYQLSELGLLPDSADACVRAHGHVRQHELILPWIDKSITAYSQL